MSYEDPKKCNDCRRDTTPCTGKRGCRHGGRWEWYIVHDRVWSQAGMTTGILCIGCLEARLGRELHRGDFPAALPINGPHPWDTPRLAVAKTRRPPAVAGVRAPRRRWRVRQVEAR